MEQRVPVDEAVGVITGRLADGWSLLGIEGLWAGSDGVRPELDCIFDGSPAGTQDAASVSALLASWPRDEPFCVEVLLVR